MFIAILGAKIGHYRGKRPIFAEVLTYIFHEAILYMYRSGAFPLLFVGARALSNSNIPVQTYQVVADKAAGAIIL